MKNVCKQLLKVSATMLLAVVFYSCGSDESPQPFRVFVGGEDVVDTMNTGAKVPTVWINGEAKYLQITGTEITNQYVRDVAYSNGHYYAVGYENSNSGWVAKIWKDNKLKYSIGESNKGFFTNSVTVENGDIYAAGSKADYIIERTFAALFQNDEVTVLSTGDATGEAFAVALSGNDVYVGGYEGNQARLWKNGNIIELPNSQNYRIKSIAVAGADVYALGECNCWEGAKVRYWKNGITTDVSGESEIAFGYSLALSGTDVYIAGADFADNKWRAKVWKNGVGTVLTPAGIVGWARDVVVDGSTVYVAGEQLSSNTIFSYAMLWTDGVPSKLGTRRSRAFSVALSEETNP
jgi:hypothetical protein